MDLSFVKKLKIQSPQETLRALVGQFENAGSGEPIYPYVTVTMGAFSFAGIPVKIEMVRNENILAILGPERGLRGQDAISYVPLNMISSVTVDNFRHHLNSLAAGMPPAAIGEAPTKLALERQLSDVSAKTGKKISCANLTSTTEEGARAYLSALAKEIEGVFAQLTADPMGKEAVAGIGQIVLTFSEGERLDIAKEGNDLKIVIGYSQKLPSLNSDLVGAIEKVI